MTRIMGSVGQGGTNLRADILIVQNLLNDHARSLAPLPALRVDGRVGPRTINAIKVFQKNVVQMASPDGRVDPGGRTLAALNSSSTGTHARFQYPAGPQEPLADIARAYIGASEAPGNRMGTDARMREIFEADQLLNDGDTDGYPWCCSFVTLCVKKLIKENRLFSHVRPPHTASVTNFRTKWAPSANCRIFRPNDSAQPPHKGDIVVFTFSHIGIVDQAATRSVQTIEGNTNAAGSREGTSVLSKSRPFSLIRCFIRMPIPASYDISNQMCVS